MKTQFKKTRFGYHALLLTFFVFSSYAFSQDSTSKQASVYFIEPFNGEIVETPFTVKFGLVNKGVAPAGFDLENTGHHHLLIDLEELPDLQEPLPKNENIIHFDSGSTEAEVTLTPGPHTLQLLFADYVHKPHTEALISKKITVTVKEENSTY